MLFKNVDEFQKYIPVNDSLSFELLETRLNTAGSRWLKPLLGKALYVKVQADFNADSADAKHLALLPYCQQATALLGFNLYLAYAQVQMSDAGFQRLESETRKSATKWQVEKIDENSLFEGYQALEDLAEFLEDSKADYPEWDYANMHRHTVNTAREFSKLVHINDSRLIFLKLVPHIERAEGNIAKTTSKALMEELKTAIAAGNLSQAQTELLEKLRPAVCHSAYASGITSLPVLINGNLITIFNNEFMQDFSPRAMPSEGILAHMARSNRELAEQYEEELLKFLNENADSYPAFKDSNSYIAPENPIDEDEYFIKEGTGFFIA